MKESDCSSLEFDGIQYLEKSLNALLLYGIFHVRPELLQENDNGCTSDSLFE